jgi:hypothetical protein
VLIICSSGYRSNAILYVRSVNKTPAMQTSNSPQQLINHKALLHIRAQNARVVCYQILQGGSSVGSNKVVCLLGFNDGKNFSKVGYALVVSIRVRFARYRRVGGIGWQMFAFPGPGRWTSVV